MNKSYKDPSFNWSLFDFNSNWDTESGAEAIEQCRTYSAQTGCFAVARGMDGEIIAMFYRGKEVKFVEEPSE